MLKFTLSFEGNDAEEHRLDFYDAAQAMLGFQRSLALTTHLVLNGEIITQAPSLKNAQIFAKPPSEGSWEVIATVGFIGSAIYKLGTAPKSTPIGHLVYSAYDYMIKGALGSHVDYDKTLGQQYEELKKHEGNELPIIGESQLDSLIEKCEPAIKEIHRPIIKSKTATSGQINASIGKKSEIIDAVFDEESYSYIVQTDQTTEIETFSGRISSYNINTFKGRIFLPDLKRPVSFILAEPARTAANVDKITRSLRMNARDRFKKGEDNGERTVQALRNVSRTGRLKSIYIVAML